MMTDGNYRRMAEQAPKVMRIVSLIISVIIGILAVLHLIVSFFVPFQTIMWWIAAGLLVVLILFLIIFVWLKPAYAYHIFRYNYSEQGVVVRKGFIFVKELKIPLFRIQNIDIDEGFIMRKYGLATLTVSTAGGNAQIQLIPKKEALKIKRIIQKRILDDIGQPERRTISQEVQHSVSSIPEEKYDKIEDTQSNNEGEKV
ncbi:PH domain-containing protein [Staphylococcus sp. 17KM0847]|uniref:PH domain-containing protein n=1 Tax=Staphylococcus sp. 17KM0847 TaxID=2583989 RepID=UPI0015DC5A67|nr:PH domain-containing protein [Staphylococcus sp. 17KM0847]QLK86486.1 hypothetical protein FGL66_07180 [Staphylococcus sp. 17KM0847]